tara:strand:- start:608 stop:925 length:318 start_codon:yes stop_codon:yes gene_type:complete
MNDAQHTSGPWECAHSEYGHYDINTVNQGEGYETLAQVHYVNNKPGGRGEADARLIAAAPEGYDANVAALGLLEEIAEADGLTPELDEVMEQLRAAIAKAKGGEA